MRPPELLRVNLLITDELLAVGRFSQSEKNSSRARYLDATLGLVGLYAISAWLTARFFESLIKELGKSFAKKLSERIRFLSPTSSPTDANRVISQVSVTIQRLELSATDLRRLPHARSAARTQLLADLRAVGVPENAIEDLADRLLEILLVDIHEVRD